MAAEPSGRRSRPAAIAKRHPVLIRAVAAVVAGLLLFGSFPPRPWWFLAPIGIALLTLSVRGTGKLRGGFGYGLLAGLGFFLPLLPWTGIYVGPVPWLALSTACAVYIGLFGLMARLLGTLPGWPLWIALAWTTAEWGRSSFPFGGFPWGRLAFGQADGWFLPLAAYGGAPLVGFAVALTGTGLAALVVALRRTVVAPDEVDRATTDAGSGATEGAGSSGSGHSDAAGSESVHGNRRRAVVTAVLVIVVMPVAGLMLRPALPAPDDGDSTITVAAIQGSVPRLGLEFNAQRRAVLDNHARRTEQLADDVDAGRAPQPDLVIWPENSSDIDPLRNTDAAAIITRAARRVGAPILVGAVLVNDDRTTTNSMMVWTEESGPGPRHDKRIIQPFGEYLPMRGFFRLFSDYADRAGYFVPGHGDGTVEVAGIDLGVATCYEVAFDRAFRDSMSAGAELLTVPTNNATFGDSEMTYQQLAMSRVRAVEHGRALVVAATSGVSAIVAADGSIQQQTELFVPAALVADLPLRTSTTLATRLGAAPEWLAIILTAGAVTAVAIRRRTRHRSEPTEQTSSPGLSSHPSA
ncbi:apolipoprotein N-acyltransferase [Nocardia cyriacigeorgica]|uniref:Apolipoprotein N-acyltransferase n=1 Tax=Nocardia cyriacigeorgica TaxID=135487 RepID=A0A6P1DFD9_9NOCA|nr:apolipoprotein N-acyltransferase [Nocardia cyriacigeorgica]NEW37376.1 apolipoprotein N-acyltransferase [Nocardia cyriacigeorgica]NEW47904.1 apolipoprotein N-acyltransferase [Nocardia cyriacigeorgica]NEW50576.1 apolipoprotein N-acyltransferase [Nocardia cyriacigeorgica]NEW57727.1 apolipoprotein N-acyltransferase [Nocardia cyriacigeorgica]